MGVGAPARDKQIHFSFLLFPPLFCEPRRLVGASRESKCFFSEANPADPARRSPERSEGRRLGGGVSGAKRLGYWWFAGFGYPERPPSGGLIGLNRSARPGK